MPNASRIVGTISTCSTVVGTRRTGNRHGERTINGTCTALSYTKKPCPSSPCSPSISPWSAVTTIRVFSQSPCALRKSRKTCPAPRPCRPLRPDRDCCGTGSQTAPAGRTANADRRGGSMKKIAVFRSSPARPRPRAVLAGQFLDIAQRQCLQFAVVEGVAVVVPAPLQSPLGMEDVGRDKGGGRKTALAQGLGYEAPVPPGPRSRRCRAPGEKRGRSRKGSWYGPAGSAAPAKCSAQIRSPRRPGRRGSGFAHDPDHSSSGGRPGWCPG